LRNSRMRLFIRISLLALFATLTVALGAPSRIAAQQAAATTSSAASNTTNPMDNPAVEEKPSNEEQQEHAFLHPPIVESVAKMLHMNDNVVSWLLVAINFAIIFFGIGIPIARILPKVMRKRSETLQADIKTAHEATEEAKSRLSAVEAKLAGLGKEIESFKTQVEQEAAADERRIKASLEEESQRIVASVEQEIGAAAAHARRSLRNLAAELAIEQATKQLVLTPETDSALIAEFISQTSGQAGVQVGVQSRGGKN